MWNVGPESTSQCHAPCRRYGVLRSHMNESMMDYFNYHQLSIDHRL